MENINLYIINSLAGALIALVIYIWTRSQSERDQRDKAVIDKLNDHEHRLSTLEGEHAVNACKGRRK